MILTGMFGAAVADAAGLGQMVLKAMENQSYDKKIFCCYCGCFFHYWACFLQINSFPWLDEIVK